MIAGAGVGGLAAAVGLADAGFAVSVIERAPQVTEIGAGIQLTPNATAALARLGLLDRVAAVAVEPRAMVIRNGRSGHEILRMPLGSTVARRFGRPWLVVHRADLIAALAAAVAATPAIKITLGTTVEAFALNPEGVTVSLVTGRERREETAAALIGADGLWSMVRRGAGDARAPVVSGRTAWRTTIPSESLPPELAGLDSGLWLGPDAHLVHYPIRRGSACNIVAVVRDETAVTIKPSEAGGSSWSGVGDPEVLIRRFERWAAPARALIEQPATWLTWRLADRPPLTAWGRGAQTLLGDAAHPMLPFLAQGAAMAIEDAVVLTQAMAAQPGNLPAALRAYEAIRRPRTARVQKEARINSLAYHLAGPAALARDVVLQTRGPAGLLSRYRWLYGWRPD
ncbi:FAD-dependent monooxygenase [Blastochloris viridis]|uniref:3-hydroxybenzoate 6-hydroxylase 1 n=1 Tax=Blastochloris viridis TaxID=1079 RepID=A0A0H5BK79_BLAVI|nr:FAD-dependent monooxygenase [Blastochloris viridis]ALK09128.1 3-hydroxybenzoate 6-hydroxylase 1 [Blastochloris viridis]BAS01007.1 salicylate hydroxylase [Blastochloris viridis]CUU41791.1 3-hydroxybenzoate 6-hydroxylase 1 [Blastochloris viridis]